MPHCNRKMNLWINYMCTWTSCLLLSTAESKAERREHQLDELKNKTTLIQLPHVFSFESDTLVFSQYLPIDTWAMAKPTFSDDAKHKSFMTWLSYRPRRRKTKTLHVHTDNSVHQGGFLGSIQSYFSSNTKWHHQLQHCLLLTFSHSFCTEKGDHSQLSGGQLCRALCGLHV